MGMTALEKQDAEINRNSKMAKRTDEYNSTVSKIISSKFSKKRIEKRQQHEQEVKNGDKYVGGYLGSHIKHIEELKSKEEPKLKEFERHPLITRIYDVFPDSVTKEEAKIFKGFELQLLDTPLLKLNLKVKRITSKSIICHITKVETIVYHRFASEEDKTVVKDLKDVTTLIKESASLEEAKRHMLRIVDRYICKYRISANSQIDPWENLLEE